MAQGVSARLAADLERLAQRHHVPGAAVALAVDGTVHEAVTGVTSTRAQVPVTTETLFMVQSVTKVLTATLVMQLVDAGRCALDDPVVAHLPTFRTADVTASRAVTVRHLLTHTGGFDGDLWAATTDGPDALERFVDDVVSRARQHAAPGERFSYCNAGYGVLGRLVEVLRGTTWEEAVRAHLAAPLGVTDIAFSADQALAFRTAIGHVVEPAGTDPRPLRSWAVMPASNPAAGNRLALTAAGLLAFATTHLRDGAAPDRTAVLSPASTRLMRTPQVDHPVSFGRGSSHGLGWWRKGEDVVEHGGGATGVASMLRLSPRHGLAAVVLTNADGGADLARELLDPWFEMPDPRSGGSVPDGDGRPAAVDTAAVLGRYEHRSARIEVAEDTTGRLRLTSTPLHEAVTMAEAAGTAATPRTTDLRAVTDRLYEAVPETGEARLVEFGEPDATGRARWVYDGARAVPRTD